MAANKHIPDIRFKGFSEEWVERKLLDNIEKVIDFRGRTPKKLGLDWSESGYLALSALNVKNGYINFDVDAHYGNQELYDKWMSGNELHKNQVLFTTEAPMGNVAQIPDDKKYILSQRTIAFEVKPDFIAEDFLAVVLGSPRMFKKLTSMSSGGTAKGVSQKSMSTLDLRISADITEQIQIGSYFQNLVKLISLHQAKVSKLVNLKKAMLEKMFPKQGADVPEIRFKGFEGAWDERTLKNIVSNISDGNWIEANHIFEEGEYRIIQTGNLGLGEFIDKASSAKYFHQKDFEEVKGNEIFSGDILISRLADPAGRTILLPQTGFRMVTAVDVSIIRPDKNMFDSTFLMTQLNTKKILLSVSESVSGTSHKRISRKNLEKIKLIVPILEEQEKIGSYFKNLDKLINLNQQELDKLNHLKKACLEKMFV